MLRRTRKILAIKSFLTLAIVPVSALGALGQSDDARKCPAVSADVPFLSQLSLGMTPAEISKVINAPIKTEPKKSAVMIDRAPDASVAGAALATKIKRELFAGETMFRYVNSPPRELLGFKGVQVVGLEFYKDRLYSFSMYYQSGDLKWKDAAGFAALASERLSLPPNFWRVNGNVAALTCQNFHLTANVNGEDRVLLYFYNPAVLQEIEAEAKRLLAEQK